jgi:tRNA(fMet)-specific endonuclease VapC
LRFLLDTDHISILQRGAGQEFVALSGRVGRHKSSDLAFSIISFHEQIVGCHTYISRARDSAGVIRGYEMLTRVIRGFSVAPVLPFDTAAATAFDGLTTQRTRVGTMDLRIAAIALSRGLILLTRNVRDFGKVAGLQLMDWTV